MSVFYSEEEIEEMGRLLREVKNLVGWGDWSISRADCGEELGDVEGYRLALTWHCVQMCKVDITDTPEGYLAYVFEWKLPNPPSFKYGGFLQVLKNVRTCLQTCASELSSVGVSE